MSKTLILTEKPSVARDFANALDVKARGEGKFEDDHYIITWAIGHLYELRYPEEYRPEWKYWNIKSMPILPEGLKYKSVPKTSKQLKIVNKQLVRTDIEKIIVATDAGREGELIARTIINQARVYRPMFRFWTSQALNPQVIKENLDSVRPLEEYDRLYYAGRARQSADWLVGINLTRLATLAFGDLCSIGRVQTAVLALLTKRRKQIDDFKPEDYFNLQAEISFEKGNLKALWFDPEKKQEGSMIKKEVDVKKIKQESSDHPAIISKKDVQQKREKPPLLFSLTELQKVANRKYNFSAKRTLQTAQRLYEQAKCLSYPRTDSKFLGQKSFSQVQGLLSKFKNIYPEKFNQHDQMKVTLKNKMVFNDARLTDHHALMPLGPYKGNNSDEKKIFQLVLDRFLAAFSKDYEYLQTKLEIKIGKHHFKTSGQITKIIGWRELLGGDQEQFLCPVELGERGDVKSLNDLKKQTRPPLEYTEALLLNDMVNPARLTDDPNLKKIFRTEVGLGTQATRAQIIETLLGRDYVGREGRHLVALDKGVQLIESLETLEISKALCRPDQTAKWEMALEEIAQGEGDVRTFMLDIRQFVLDCFYEWKNKISEAPPTRKARSSNAGEKIGICPKCKSEVIEYTKAFSCSASKSGCDFVIWKTIAGKKISKTQAIKILKQGRTDKLKGFKSKKGKSFSAGLIFQDGKIQFSFQ